MMRHTPGPWAVFDDGTNPAGIARYADDSPYNDGRDTKIIAAFPEYRGEGEGFVSDDELEANARLVTAAPDMYDELVRAEEVLRINGFIDHADRIKNLLKGI